MIDRVKKFFGAADESSDKPDASHHDVRVAACALFIEMATIDDEFDSAELEHILNTLEERFGVADEYAQELIVAAKKELEGGIDLWRFTNLVNKNYSNREKFDVVKLLWELVYADGQLSDHENYLMRKMGNMLRLSHKELINAKLTVLKSKPDA